MMPDKQVYFHEGYSIVIHEKKRIQYEENQKIGNYNISYVKEAHPVIDFKDKREKWRGLKTVRRAEFKCHCGKHFENTIQQIKTNKVMSCGCLRVENAKILHTHRKKK